MKLRFTEMLLKSDKQKRVIVNVRILLVGAICLICVSPDTSGANEDGANIWRMFNNLLSNQQFLEYLHATDDPARFPIDVCCEQLLECKTVELGSSGKVTLSFATKRNTTTRPVQDVVHIETKPLRDGTKLEFKYGKEGIRGYIAFNKEGNITTPIEIMERR